MMHPVLVKVRYDEIRRVAGDKRLMGVSMVLIWNDLACGDRETAAVLVAVNSVFQMLASGALGWFYFQVLPGWLGLPTTSARFSAWAIMASVLVFLSIPLVGGFLTRLLGERTRGRQWY